MIEIILLDYLEGALKIPVTPEYPEDPPERFVVLRFGDTQSISVLAGLVQLMAEPHPPSDYLPVVAGPPLVQLVPLAGLAAVDMSMQAPVAQAQVAPVTVALTALMALPLAQVVAMEARGREQQRENSARKTENCTPEVELEQAIRVAYPPLAVQAAVVIWEAMELPIQAAVLVMRLMARTTEVLALRSFAIRGGRHNGKEYDTY